LQFLEQIRARRYKTPILVLTAVDAVHKILRAFDLGADDYLVKPFLVKILLPRVRAIARRTQSTEPAVIRAGGITLALPNAEVVNPIYRLSWEMAAYRSFLDVSPKVTDIMTLRPGVCASRSPPAGAVVAR
jgi:DNA-binding response OmpR family regulator